MLHTQQVAATMRSLRYLHSDKLIFTAAISLHESDGVPRIRAGADLCQNLRKGAHGATVYIGAGHAKPPPKALS